jgi:predicted HTH transcriptional regulator
LKVKIERESRARRLPALSEKIVELAQDHGRISIKFISTTLETNRNTVKKHAQQLVKMGQLVRHGKSPFFLHLTNTLIISNMLNVSITVDLIY